MPRLSESGISLRAYDSNGDPVSGALLRVYLAGTSTPVTIYSNAALSVVHPGVANAAGIFTPAFLASGAYKVDILDPDTLASLPGFPIDNVSVGSGENYTTVELLIASTEVSRGTGAIWEAAGYRYTEVTSGEHLTTAGGVKLRMLRDNGAYNLRGLCESFDGSTDNSTELDALLSYIWDNYTEYPDIIIPHLARFDKAGDFDIPPGTILRGESSRCDVTFGNALTRFRFKMDRVTIPITANEYRALPGNMVKDMRIKAASGVTVANTIQVSDLRTFRLENVTSGEATVAVNVQNDAEYTEFWRFEECNLKGTTAAILFDKAPTFTGTDSAGHGYYSGYLDVRGDGTAGILVRDGMSPYNATFNITAFLGAPTVGQEAYLFKLEDAGSDIVHSQIFARIENLGNNGQTYGVHVSGGADGTKINGSFVGVGSNTKFRGVTSLSNIISTMESQPLNLDGATRTGQNGVPHRVTGFTDANGDNYMQPVDLKEFSVFINGAVPDGAPVMLLPRFLSSSASIIDVRLRSELAPGHSAALNTNGGWRFGIFKSGAGSPAATFTMTDGDNDQLIVLGFSVPSTWAGEQFHEIRASGTAAGVNDGNPPSNLVISIRYIDR